MPPISQLLENGETPEQVLYRLLGEDEVEILEKCLYNLNVTVLKKNLRPL